MWRIELVNSGESTLIYSSPDLTLVPLETVIVEVEDPNEIYQHKQMLADSFETKLSIAFRPVEVLP